MRRFAWFFSAFLIACGLAHMMDVWTIWHPDYWLSGAVKAAAALASLATVAALFPLMRYARALRTLGELDGPNGELESTNARTSVDAAGNSTGIIATIAATAEHHDTPAAPADSEHQCRLLAEAMPHPVYMADAAGTVFYFNTAWHDYSGLALPECRSQASLTLVHPDDRERTRAAWATSISTGVPFETQLRMRRGADGMYRWFVSRATAARAADGTIVRWIGSAADIHDFKVATETRSVLDTLGHMISIQNQDGTLDYVSPSWTQFAGFSGDEVGGRRRDLVHPDDLDVVDALDRSSREAPLVVHQNEIRVRAANGDYRWFLTRSVALPATSGSAPRRVDTLTDIDDLKRAQAAFGYSESRYRALTDAMPQLVWIVDDAGALEYVNERWSTFTGLPYDPERSRSWESIVYPDDRAQLTGDDRSIPGEANFECEVRLRRYDGAFRWHLLRGVPLDDVPDHPAKWIVTATDTEAHKTAEAALASSARELRHRAHHDPLTDLPNRARLVERLESMIARADADGTQIVVLYLDIDRFKTINDTLGHTAGDQLLIEVARRVGSILRSEDIASRFGGDEFVVVCNAAGSDDAARIADRVQAALREPFDLAGKRVIVSSSIGVSVFPHDGKAAGDLILRADIAMDDAKQSGRDAWLLYSTQAHLPAIPALEIEAELRTAIAQNQFVVYYQPIVCVESGRPLGAEALVRWNHPERGLLDPGTFIPFAENHGLIGAIGEIVLRAACAEIRRLDLRAGDDFSIAVNVSARQFAKPGFVATIASALESYGLDARRLEIEITESVVMGDTVPVIGTLEKLKALGVKLSIDDFGTGYSSLAYIKNFPIHTLKIDRSFVAGIAANFADQAIAKTIITLAHSLGMRVIAEGVEDRKQLEMLRSFGADCVQGYLISRPMPVAAFEAYLSGRRSVVRDTP
jgi:diguanylate cyclase (GGDEF)-like protein/PAS domain S-box-containing protein